LFYFADVIKHIGIISNYSSLIWNSFTEKSMCAKFHMTEAYYHLCIFNAPCLKN